MENLEQNNSYLTEEEVGQILAQPLFRDLRNVHKPQYGDDIIEATIPNISKEVVAGINLPDISKSEEPIKLNNDNNFLANNKELAKIELPDLNTINTMNLPELEKLKNDLNLPSLSKEEEITEDKSIDKTR